METYGVHMDTNINPLDAEVSRTVAEAIDSRSRTRKSISDETGIPRTTLIRKLSGYTPFTVVELARIAKALGVDVLELIPRDAA